MQKFTNFFLYFQNNYQCQTGQWQLLDKLLTTPNQTSAETPAISKKTKQHQTDVLTKNML